MRVSLRVVGAAVIGGIVGSYGGQFYDTSVAGAVLHGAAGDMGLAVREPARLAPLGSAARLAGEVEYANGHGSEWSCDGPDPVFMFAHAQELERENLARCARERDRLSRGLREEAEREVRRRARRDPG